MQDGTRGAGTNMSCLGIIGTAGRREDGGKLSRASFDLMCEAGRAVLGVKGCRRLVSGGAAWADHVAVTLALDGTVDPAALTLHLPAAFEDGRFDADTRDGGTANHYHRLFYARSGIDGLAEIAEVLRRGARAAVNRGGFLARNLDVARASDVLLAFTFGAGEAWRARVHGDVTAAQAGLKDGGTAHTFDRCRATTKVHVALARID